MSRRERTHESNPLSSHHTWTGFNSLNTNVSNTSKPNQRNISSASNDPSARTPLSAWANTVGKALSSCFASTTFPPKVLSMARRALTAPETVLGTLALRAGTSSAITGPGLSASTRSRRISWALLRVPARAEPIHLSASGCTMASRVLVMNDNINGFQKKKHLCTDNATSLPERRAQSSSKQSCKQVLAPAPRHSSQASFWQNVPATREERHRHRFQGRQGRTVAVARRSLESVPSRTGEGQCVEFKGSNECLANYMRIVISQPEHAI